MNQTFLSFTFTSDAPTLLLLETEQGAEITIEDGQAIAFDQINDMIEALKAIKASGVKKQGNGEGKKEDNGEAEGEGKVISSGSILPPFNFNTPEKLAALMGRKVELRNGSVHTIECVCDDANALDGGEEVIGLDNKMWIFKDGTYYGDFSASSEDIVKVLPASN